MAFLKKINVLLLNNIIYIPSINFFKIKGSSSTVHHHSLQTGHHFFIRVKPPQELYCGMCKDFKYCTLFDNVCGKKSDRLDEVISTYTNLQATSWVARDPFYRALEVADKVNSQLLPDKQTVLEDAMNSFRGTPNYY
jgi:hypothetical protein